MQGERVKLKKYFYVLRPILACKWILAEGAPPPMEFRALADKYLDETIVPDVERLLDLKMNTPEITTGKRFEKVNDYLDKTIKEIERAIAELPKDNEQGWDKLNALFWAMLGE